MHRLQPAQRFTQHVARNSPRIYGAHPFSGPLTHHEQEHHALDATNPRHLLRHLLREITYLPDPMSRVYFRQYILRRFGDYSASAIAASRVLEARIPSKLREARKALSTLRKANRGFFLQVKKVLDHTYGRLGRRSRQLMEPLKRSTVCDIATSNIVLEALSNHPTTLPANIAAQIPRLTVPVEKLYREQQRRHRYLDKSLRLAKTKGPDLTQLNAWHQPLPACRVKNQVKRWYSDVLSRLLPPLPSEEWALLQGLSSGSIQWHTVQHIKRRVMAGTITATCDYKALESELGVSAWQLSPSGRGRKQPHRITDRFMRRRWAGVLAKSPRLDVDEGSSRLSVTWATPEPFARKPQVVSSLRAALAEDD